VYYTNYLIKIKVNNIFKNKNKNEKEKEE